MNSEFIILKIKKMCLRKNNLKWFFAFRIFYSRTDFAYKLLFQKHFFLRNTYSKITQLSRIILIFQKNVEVQKQKYNSVGRNIPI